MNIHKNARLTPQGRLLLVERITQHGWSVAQAARGGRFVDPASLPLVRALPLRRGGGAR